MRCRLRRPHITFTAIARCSRVRCWQVHRWRVSRRHRTKMATLGEGLYPLLHIYWRLVGTPPVAGLPPTLRGGLLWLWAYAPCCTLRQQLLPTAGRSVAGMSGATAVQGWLLGTWACTFCRTSSPVPLLAVGEPSPAGSAVTTARGWLLWARASWPLPLRPHRC